MKVRIIMKWSRDEYLDLVTFKECERQMFVELFGPLVGLDNEWKMQGATEDELSLKAFDWDYVPIIHCGGNTNIINGFIPRVIEDTKEHTIAIDSLGRTTKLKKGFATIALPMDYPVKTMDDWMKIKHMYEFDESRINWDKVENAKNLQKKGHLVVAGIPGGFDFPRELMGEENACVCYYEDEELMTDMLQTISDTSFKVLNRISDEITIDQLSVHEDMAGKSGPMLGPNLILKFLKPYYRNIWDMLSSKGTRIFAQDSDGNMTAVIDAFLECGLNQMYPMEPAAGMDIVEVRKKYGNKLSIRGGIDKHVLRLSKEDIRKELEYKMQPLMLKGGTVFGIDHRITNGTPLENYRYYVELGRELLGLPQISEIRNDHNRMAF